MNDLGKYINLFDNFEPFKGYVPRGFSVDFLGRLTDATFRTMWGVDPDQEGGRYEEARLPGIDWGDGFFEAIDWFEAAREARGSYTMITLGACFGAQAVCAYLALQRLNPMPVRLVAVEAVPENFVWLQKHFRDNGIDPDRHWLVNCALGGTNDPVLFPIGAPGSGANNCLSTNNAAARQQYARQLCEASDVTERLYNLLVNFDTGVDVDLVPGMDFPARVKVVSTITLRDVLAPFDRVDLLESDIQRSEQIVFPPAMDLIRSKVKRVHVGTHGADVHEELLQAFAVSRFEIVFNYPPNMRHETPWGSFDTNDGVITARNLDL